MKRIQCPSCGAPLPKAPTAGSTVTCEYCGAEYGPDATQKMRAVTADLSGQRRQVGEAVGRAGRWVAGVVVAVFALAMGITALVVFVSYRATKDVSRQVVRAIESVPSPRAETWTPAELPRLTADRVDVALTTSAPPTTLDRFDAGASLPWALAIAQSWKKDVRLERVDAERVRPDGTVDAAGDAEAEVLYRFWSPSQIEEFHRRADLTRDAKVACEFWVRLKNGKVMARVLDGRPHEDPLPPFPEVPPLSTTFAALTARPDFPRKPFFNAYLLNLSDEGWVWYMRTLGGDSLPRVRARDGKPWPFR